jgi:hypothetical protein
MALRLFVDGLNPSNTGNRSGFGEDWMNSSLWLVCTRFAIPSD